MVDTNLRDQFIYRLAMRCSTPEASETILGRGHIAQGFNAAHISPNMPGTGFFYGEDGETRRLRARYQNDDEIRALAARAKKGRGR